MARRVFGPAGMTRTGAEFNDSLIPFRSRFYAHADSAAPARNAPYVDNSYKWAGGGFLSTTEDLARFGRKLLEGKLLRPATRDLLWASQKTADGTVTNYGLGWRSGVDGAGRHWVGHTGGSVGGTANLVIFPEQHLVIAVLVNSDRTFISAAPRIAGLFIR
jgi:CubicO group peptidase (beta-lactamase class C family)